MKAIRLLLIQIFILTCVWNSDGQVANTVSETKSTVYLIRQKNFVGSILKMKINLNGQHIATLSNGEVVKYELAPGTYSLSCKMGSTASLNLRVDANKEYYIGCYVLKGFTGTPDLLQINDSSGIEIMAELTKKPKSNDYYSTDVNSNRIGINVGYGAAMNPISLGTTTQNEALTLSAAGGLYVGLEIGDQTTKNFDISTSIFYQRCNLMPSISNGTGSFERFGLLLSPAIVIPIKGGEVSRIRLVGGPGIYIGSSLKLNIPDLSLSNESVSYWPAFGFHASATYDRNITENTTLSIGLKYTLLQYIYKDMDDIDSSLDDTILYPDGSAFDFLIGYHVRF